VAGLEGGSPTLILSQPRKQERVKTPFEEY
jgi:hypothetical protein